MLVSHIPEFTTDKFVLNGIWEEPNQSGFQHTLYQMEVTSDDYQKVSTDSSHICQPVIRKEISSRFILPLPGSLRSVAFGLLC